MKRIFAFLLAVTFPMSAFATFDCNVNIIQVLVYSNGAVNVLHTGRGEFTVICNLNSNYGEASPTTCAMWTAMLQSIKKKGGSANFYFNGEGSCATMETYHNAPVPVYIGDVL